MVGSMNIDNSGAFLISEAIIEHTHTHTYTYNSSKHTYTSFIRIFSLLPYASNVTTMPSWSSLIVLVVTVQSVARAASPFAYGNAAYTNMEAERERERGEED